MDSSQQLDRFVFCRTSYSKQKASRLNGLSGSVQLHTCIQAAETESEHTLVAAVGACGWHTAWCMWEVGAWIKQVCTATVSSVFLKRPVHVIT